MRILSAFLTPHRQAQSFFRASLGEFIAGAAQNQRFAAGHATRAVPDENLGRPQVFRCNDNGPVGRNAETIDIGESRCRFLLSSMAPGNAVSNRKTAAWKILPTGLLYPAGEQRLKYGMMRHSALPDPTRVIRIQPATEKMTGQKSGSACEWRQDLDSVIFTPAGHAGYCAVHRLAFRAPIGCEGDPAACLAFFTAHSAAFDSAAQDKIRRRSLPEHANLHLNSRDIRRALAQDPKPAAP